MALLVVRTTEGHPVLVHSSFFDPLKVVDFDRPQEPRGAWPDVWARVDQAALGPDARSRGSVPGPSASIASIGPNIARSAGE